jgi:pimeloyl-ACP methyl ester carboxylesterase
MTATPSAPHGGATAHPKLIFLPGAGADPAFWRPLGDRLPADWPKTYLGWPGLGWQPPDPAVNSIDDLVRLTEAQLGDEPVDLLAQSMGGLVAILVALRRPEAVRRIVLSVTSAGVDMPSLGAADWRQTYLREHPRAGAWITDPRPDLSAVLPTVSQPTLLLWGGADPISPPAVGERLAALMPNAVLQVTPGAGHDLVQTHAAALAARVEAHLA